MVNILNWFEIPAADFSRAKAFYETMLGVAIHAQDMNGMRVGFFPQAGDAVGGAIMHGPGQTPGATGITIYFKGGVDLGIPLARAVAAGAKVLLPKTLINEQIGHIALLLDTEGNRIGLHSML